MAGDQQAALIGQACFQPGMAKSTYGTGCFALIHIGDMFKESRNRLLTTTAYRLGGKASYAIEGSIFIAGAAIQWLRDGIHLFDKASKSEDLARSVPDNGGVYFVPAFTGLGAPYWRPEARGLLTGIGRETNAAHLARAALEAQAYQTLDLVAAMENDSGTNLEILRADGGLVTNVFMCQFLADMLDRKVQLPHVIETTAWGAASLAGLQAGVFNDLSNISQAWRAGSSYEPRMTAQDREKLYDGWKAAISKVLA
jgi:glycerol kinase